MPDWDNQKALTIFEQMLARNGNKIDAVARGERRARRRRRRGAEGAQPQADPADGQDATPQGVQYILAGWQTRHGLQGRPQVEADAAANGRDRT